MIERVCTETGLALVASPVSALRIARESRGPLAPPPRSITDDVAFWGRYDTIASTLYASDDRLTAYMELLAPYRTKIDEARRALQKEADFIGVPLEELWQKVVAEWDEAGNMKASWLPRNFRDGRSLFTLKFPSGWWVDMTATDTLAAINRHFDAGLPTSKDSRAEPLTLAQVTGDDRTLTTAIATWLREDVVLDDGSVPLGVRFLSKHGRPPGGTGMCWGYWMRATDLGEAEPVVVTDTEPILETDTALKKAQEHCKIKTR